MNNNDKEDKNFYDAFMDILQDIHNSFVVKDYDDDLYYDENEWLQEFLNCQKHWDEEEE
jgi:hypothetical protein